MKVILANYNGGDSFKIFKAKEENLVTVMRELWEDVYNDQIAYDDSSINEEDTWFEEDQSQVVSISGQFIAEFKIMEVEEL